MYLSIPTFRSQLFLQIESSPEPAMIVCIIIAFVVYYKYFRKK